MPTVDIFIEGLNSLSAEEQEELIRPFLNLGGIRKKDLKLALKDEIRGDFPKRDHYQYVLEKFVRNVESYQDRIWRELGY